MSNAIATYLRQVQAARRAGNDTEHTHRPALKQLLETLDSRITAVNEPKRSACGAPDFLITRNSDGLALGNLEAKDIGVSLDEAKKSDQLKRYLPALSNLILTDYLEFRWFLNGAERARFRLAEIQGRNIVPDAAAIDTAGQLLKEFLDREPLRIDSAEELARRLARLTHLIRDAIVVAFQTGNASELLTGWRTVFAETLLPELADDAKVPDFADMFAQTLAYGLFSARAMSSTSAKFTLGEAAKLIPRTNPFLRDFFDLITGPKLDDEAFAGYVQDLVTLLECADMGTILEDFGRGIGAGRRRDPVVHFYETFLAAYDPKLRELRGVYYTPEPVVSYIVESIDWLLREKFGLKDGLADKSKVTSTREEKGKTIEEETHRVLILDPATGTGTFLFEVIERIRERFEKKHQAGLWPSYVHEHLLPRLFGFELLMAPYAVAHFKLGLELSARHLPVLFREEWAYHFTGNERLNVFLTNTLEDAEQVAPQFGPLAILSKEANAAHAVKTAKPVLVVLGNPPYSGHSANKGEWIGGLVRDYYQVDGSPLQERNSKWLQDDYVKFIRWAQWRITSTGQGVLGFITNHRYLTNPTFRGMRQQLMQAFDALYVLDLHGSSQPRETPPAGAANENVFDIEKGVAICLFVKRPADAAARSKRRGSARVFHAEVWGTRAQKYNWLGSNNAKTTSWTELTPAPPYYLFEPRVGPGGADMEAEYMSFTSLADIFPFRRMGPNSHRDHFAVALDAAAAQQRVRDLADPRLADSEIIRRYDLKESGDWKLAQIRKTNFRGFQPTRCLYRPFDYRYMLKADWAYDRLRADLLHHLEQGTPALLTLKQADEGFAVFVADCCVGQHKLAARYDGSYVIPLYLYPNGKRNEEDLFAHDNGRRPNLSASFITTLEQRLKLKFVPEGRGNLNKTFGPEDVLHYAYAVFHSYDYRSRYAQFLRLDFPRVPLTTDVGLFRSLCKCGGKLIALHTLRDARKSQVTFPIAGGNRVDEVAYQHPRPARPGYKRKGQLRRDPDERSPAAARPGRVYINSTQYFEGVDAAVWGFRIGGYQVCEKWLKDRKGRTLVHDDLEHYQHTVSALAETRRRMAEVDSLIADHGGWPLG